MKKLLTSLALMTTLLCPRLEAGEKLDVLKLTDGTEYKSVEIMGVSAKGLRILHTSGAANVPIDQLPADLQAKYAQAQKKAVEEHAIAEAAAKTKAEKEAGEKIKKAEAAAKAKADAAKLHLEMAEKMRRGMPWSPPRATPDAPPQPTDSTDKKPTETKPPETPKSTTDPVPKPISPTSKLPAGVGPGQANEPTEPAPNDRQVEIGPDGKYLIKVQLVTGKMYGIAEALADANKLNGKVIRVELIVNALSQITGYGPGYYRIFVGDPFMKDDSTWAWIAFPEAGRKKIQAMLNGTRGRMSFYMEVRANDRIKLHAVGRSTWSAGPNSPINIVW